MPLRLYVAMGLRLHPLREKKKFDFWCQQKALEIITHEEFLKGLSDMTDTTKAVVKIQGIAETLVNLTHRLEQDLTPDAHEKLMQDFADEVDKLEEIISGL